MIIHQRKKMLVLTCITALFALIVISFKPAAGNFPQQQRKLKNLKVFPANSTYDSVDHVMDEFKVELGVKCNYCHAQSKENPRQRDMASDDNPKKDITRDMMRMTDEMNKKYIQHIPHADTVTVQHITCNTCHRGQAKPAVK